MITNNENNRNRVLKYIKKYNCSPLIFVNGKFDYHIDRYVEIESDEFLEVQTNILKESKTLLELVLNILDDKEYLYSKNTTEVIETDSGRHRSVLDIWRHVLYYKPDTTIFEVMKLLSDNRDELAYQWCYVVKRRVFDRYPGSIEGRYNAGERDEFGLYFKDWGTILDEDSQMVS